MCNDRSVGGPREARISRQRGPVPTRARPGTRLGVAVFSSTGSRRNLARGARAAPGKRPPPRGLARVARTNSCSSEPKPSRRFERRLVDGSRYGASSLCWPRLHFDLPNQILRFRPPKCGHTRSAPQTPSKNAIKYICKKGTFFWRHQDVLHPMAEYSSTPKGVLEYPWSTPCGYPLGGNTWATTRVGDRHSAIRAPRSGRLLLRRDLIFELVNAVVNEARKRAFSARG